MRALLAMLLLTAAGCGQSGDLFLPVPPEDTVTPPATTPEAPEPDEQSEDDDEETPAG